MQKEMEKERWEKAKNIFEQAMEIAPEAREKFLNEVCADDKIVRREVEELLESLDETKSFLETPVVSPKNTKLENGQIFGHYEIIKPIGTGGMGEVFLAKDTRLKRQVALKLLPAEFTADKEKLRRFEQEAFAASMLNHPNILTIYEIGASDGVTFIATEFIEGETLRNFINRNDLTLPKILDISIQAVSALAAAHEANIVHRDIKPENIMIRGDGIVKVLDFGLAKTVKSETVDAEKSTQHLIQTQQGVIMGTVAYMSPEQTRGKAIDTRTDIWSFGVVLYEMIAGQVPFRGETISDIIASILKTNPAPLPEETPSELNRIITKTLQRDQEKRYQTTKDLLVDLKNLKQEIELDEKLAQTVSQRKTVILTATTSEKANETVTNTSLEYVKNRRLPTILILIVLLLGISSIGYYFWQNKSTGKSDETGAIDSIAVLPLVNASQDPDAEFLSDGITESLINRLSQLPSLKVMSRSSVFRYKGKEMDAQKVGNELNVRSVLTGDVKQIGDQLAINVELIDTRDNHQIWGEQYVRKFADVFAVQSEIARDISAKLRLKLSGAEQQKLAKRYTDNPEAYQLYLKGRFYWNKRTSDGMVKGIEYFNQAIKLDPTYALAYSGLADCYILRPGPFTTKERVEKGSAAAQRALEIDETLAEAHASLARIKSEYEWDWVGADREFNRAFEISPNYATAHQWYALHLGWTGRADEAVQEAQRAQELDPLSLSINTTLGWTLLFARRYDEAIAQFRKTLEMDPKFADALFALARSYTAKKMYDEAIATMQKAIQADDDPKLLAILGHIYAVSGRKADALKILDELAQLPKEKAVPLDNIATIYVGLGNKDKAFDYLEKAYQERSPGMRTLRIDERLDTIRDDLRFSDLLQRVERLR